MKHLLVALTLSLLSTTPAWSMPRHCDSLAKDSTEVKKNDEKNKKQPEKKETEYEKLIKKGGSFQQGVFCLLYTSPSPRDTERYRMPSSA